MAKRTTSQLRIVEHPVLGELLTAARRRETPPPRFRQVMAQIGMLLAYEATRDLRTRKVRIDTPLETMDGVELRDAVTIVPILRAGMGLVEGISRIFPEAPIGHIGMFRDERALRPVSYYEKLPPTLGQGVTLLVDPMLATGGSAVAGLELLKQRGARDVRMVCVLASPEGVKKLAKVHPTTPVFTAALDRELDDRGYILPGLGDAGDRLFGTGGR